MGARHGCIVLLSLACLLQCVGCGNPDISQETRAAEAVLGLQGPVTVQKVAVYTDGGSTGVTLKDSSGRTLSFCTDFQMDALGPGKQRSTHGDLFLGATHPTYDGATHVEPRGVQEKAICTILQEWLNRNVSGRKRRAWLRDRGVNELTKEEAEQRRVLSLVEYLKTR